MPLNKITLSRGIAILAVVALGFVPGSGFTQVPPVAYHDYEKYKTLRHYRAFATTRMMGSVAGGWGWTGNHGTVENAINNAMKRCEKGRSGYGALHECKLHSIGNIVVYGMKPAQLEAATELYETNAYATKDDLPNFIATRPLRSKITKHVTAGTSGRFDGRWEGSMRCGNCPNCTGPLEKHVNINIESSRFELVPDASYMGVGVIDDDGNVEVKWQPATYDWGYQSRKFFLFFGSYEGGSLVLFGERGPRSCDITLSRVSSP